MDTNQLQKIKDIIAKSDKIGIAVGKNPTIDEMGAALSLYLALQAMNKSVSIASPTDPIVELSSLVGIDKVTTKFESAAGDLVVSFPYREGEIEKVSYTIDDGLLNIVVKAGEQGLTFNEKDIKYTRGGDTPTLLFVVGTPHITDLGALFSPEELKDTTVVNIDNKDSNQKFGDLVLVSSRFSSVSEQIADLLLSLGVDIDVDCAQNLLSGIAFATSNFQDQKTSYLAFEIAAVLMKKGARRISLRETNAQAPVMQQMPSMDVPFGQQRNSTDQKEYREARQGLQDLSSFMPKPESQNQPKRDQMVTEGKNPPADWLTPKVYKGSTNI